VVSAAAKDIMAQYRPPRRQLALVTEELVPTSAPEVLREAEQAMSRALASGDPAAIAAADWNLAAAELKAGSAPASQEAEQAMSRALASGDPAAIAAADWNLAAAELSGGSAPSSPADSPDGRAESQTFRPATNNLRTSILQDFSKRKRPLGVRFGMKMQPHVH